MQPADSIPWKPISNVPARDDHTDESAPLASPKVHGLFHGHAIGHRLPFGARVVQQLVSDPDSPANGIELVVVYLPSATVRQSLEIPWAESAEYSGPINIEAHYRTIAPRAIAYVNGAPGVIQPTDPEKLLPLGLFVREGHQYTNFARTGLGGVLRVTDKSAWMVPVRSYEVENFGPTDSAMQGLPLLIEQGSIGIRSNDLEEQTDRTCFAIDTAGDVFYIGVFSRHFRTMSLYDFAAVLTQLTSPTGAKIAWALDLDGGPGSRIYIPSIGKSWGSAREYVVVDYVVALPASTGETTDER